MPLDHISNSNHHKLLCLHCPLADPELLTKAPAWSYTFPAQQPSNTATSQLIQCTTDRQRLAVIYAASHLYSGDQLEEMLQKCSPPQMVAVDDAYRPELAALLLHATGWLTAKRLGELCRFACVATAGASAAQQLDGLADLVLGPEGVVSTALAVLAGHALACCLGLLLWPALQLVCRYGACDHATRNVPPCMTTQHQHPCSHTLPACTSITPRGGGCRAAR